MLPLHRKYSTCTGREEHGAHTSLLNTSEMTMSSPEEMDVRLSLGAVPYGYLPCRIMVASKQVAPRTTHFSLFLSPQLRFGPRLFSLHTHPGPVAVALRLTCLHGVRTPISLHNAKGGEWVGWGGVGSYGGRGAGRNMGEKLPGMGPCT